MPVKASYLLLASAGAIVAIAGFKGWGVGNTIRDVISGKNPASQPTANPITGSSFTSPNAPVGNTGASSASAIANQAIARSMALVTHPSWVVGQQWADWKSLWNQESGWSNTARNPGSGALGVAQALGHGTPNTAGRYGDEYGAEYGLSARAARAANNGSAVPQIRWGIGYIASDYGSPSGAWAHETANGWY